MNQEAVQELLKKKPELKSAKAKLEAMQPGSYCIHRSWGFGLIKEYDEADEKLIIDFEDKPGHRMDPVFCISTMEVLAADHILARKQTESKVIDEMIAKQPADLVIELLKQYPNSAATSAELESILVQVVGESRFKKWWTATKKTLAKDPRIAAPAKKTECYVLREDPISIEDELLEEFSGTRSARRKITIADKLLATADTKKEVQSHLAEVLESVATAVKDSNQLTSAERLNGAWVRDDIAEIASVENNYEPSIMDLVAEPRDLEAIAAALATTRQTRLLKLVKEAHPTEWKDIVFNLLKSSHGKFTTDCINFLLEHASAEEISDTFKRWQTEQNLRADVLLWIVKNRHSRKFSTLLHELITPRLLSAIFFAIDYEALQSSGTRRIPLGELLSEDVDLIPDLLSTADPEIARDLANNLMLNQGFEELTKKSLLARFIKYFPNVQSLVAGEADQKDDRLLVSQESHDRVVKEYEEIVSKKIPDNSKAIAEARGHGDLKENSEYKMAKQEQSLLLARKAKAEQDLSKAQISDFAEAPLDQIGVGNVATLYDKTSKKTITYTILGAWDSDPDNSIISYKTPMGASLLSKKVGDEVNVQIGDTDNVIVVKDIKRYVDLKK